MQRAEYGGRFMDFLATKLGWALLAPANLLVLFLTSGVFLTLWPRRRRLGMALVWLAAAGFGALAVLPVGQWVGRPLEERFPHPAALPEKIGGIIVLGGAVDPVVTATRGLPTLTDAAERMVAFVALARRYPDAPLIISGGSGLIWDRDSREGDVVQAVLEQLEFDTGRVMIENLSRNTWENALFSRDLADLTGDAPWLLVTSANHMPRSVGIFRRLGWPVIPYPVDYRTRGDDQTQGILDVTGNLNLTSTMVREWIGLAAYHAMSRTDRLFPGP